MGKNQNQTVAEAPSKASLIRAAVAENPGMGQPELMKLLKERHGEKMKISASEIYQGIQKVREQGGSANGNGATGSLTPPSPESVRAVANHIGNLKTAVAELGLEGVLKLVKVLG